MSTLNQLIKNKRIKKDKNYLAPALNHNPQKKGICLKVYTITPKKPNSAIRKITKIKLSNNINILSYIPGEGHNLQEHSIVLIRGGKTQDLPGLKYKCIRGKYDLQPIITRKKSRSKYGTKKIN